MTDAKHYHSYLLTRSVLARFYRNFYLYPKINTNLNGIVLDVGCGIGDFLRFRENTIGIDINESIVEHCKKEGLNVQYFERDAIPFNDNYFDGAILDNVLEHIEDPGEILVEIKRVVKKGGILIVGVPGIRGYHVDNDHKRYYDEHRLKLLAERFRFIQIRTFYTPLFKSTWLSKRLRQYCMFTVFGCNK
jgi:SAM-dependent methyltransferase